MPVTEFSWDPLTDSVLEETDGAGSVQVMYTNEPTQWGPLLTENRAGQVTQYHCDVIGGTRLLTNSQAAVFDTFMFDAWGTGLLHSGLSVTPLRWGGQLGYHTSQFGSHALLYIRHRSYSPGLARWLTADPAERYPQLSRYGMADNSPLLFVDPSGQVACQFNRFIRAWQPLFPKPPNGQPGAEEVSILVLAVLSGSECTPPTGAAGVTFDIVIEFGSGRSGRCDARTDALLQSSTFTVTRLSEIGICSQRPTLQYLPPPVGGGARANCGHIQVRDACTVPCDESKSERCALDGLRYSIDVVARALIPVPGGRPRLAFNGASAEITVTADASPPRPCCLAPDDCRLHAALRQQLWPPPPPPPPPEIA